MKLLLVIDADESLAGKVGNEIEICSRKYGVNWKIIPMPEKNTWDITKNGHVTEYAEGYNACIDEIMGETE